MRDPMITVAVKGEEAPRVKVDVLVLGVTEGTKQLYGVAAAVDAVLGRVIAQALDRGIFRAKRHETYPIPAFGRLGAGQVLAVGVGKREEFTRDRARQVAGVGCRAARRLGARTVALVVESFETPALGRDPRWLAQALTEGGLLGLYRFDAYLSRREDRRDVQTIWLLDGRRARQRPLGQGVDRGILTAEATNLARRLVDEPANVMTPAELAGRAAAAVRGTGVRARVLEQPELERLKMGSLLSVARGSDHPPRLILLEYRPPGAPKGVHLGLLGKGVTFDSGGISIKPSEGMHEMKGDMAGGAAVIGAMRIIGRMRPNVTVSGIVPAVENMPSGHASRPGDIVRAMNGTSIEILNTDAEGRLILADAICYARQKLRCTALVDIATLTGAIRIALGWSRTGVFSNNPRFLARVTRAAGDAGEVVWPMPYGSEERDLMKGEITDLKNISGGKGAGASTASAFLSAFVDDTPWVHLDIAGTAWTDKEGPYLAKGATGMGVRTLANVALGMGRK